MADRIDTIGGTLNIQSEPSAGTTVSGTVPATRNRINAVAGIPNSDAVMEPA